jgi:hypothetical protein
MNFTKTVFVAIATSFLLSFTIAVDSFADPLVGVWNESQQTVVNPIEPPLEVVASFHSDGTYDRSLDISIQRFFQNGPFVGTVFSLSECLGQWKKISKGHYEYVGTQVVLARPVGSVNFLPIARLKEEGTIRLHGNTFKAKHTISFYNYTDLTLTQATDPNLPPPLDFAIEAVRLVKKNKNKRCH